MRRPLASFASFASLIAATFVLGLAFDARGDAGGSAGGGSAGSAGSGSAGSGGSTDNGDKDKDTDKRPATCDDACDKIAAKCVDACEEAHKGKPLPRVTCKIACGDARRACSDKCSKKLAALPRSLRRTPRAACSAPKQNEDNLVYRTALTERRRRFRAA